MYKKILLTIFISFFCITSVKSEDFQSVFNEAMDLVEQNYYDASLNNQNWERWKKHYANKIKTQEDLNIAIKTSLISLGDIYTRYLTKEDFSEEKNDIHSDDIVSLQYSPRYFKTRIPENVKYIRIDSMMNKNLPSEIHDLIIDAEKNPSLKGYIIDIRDDGGGLVKNATDIASLFMENKIVLYAKTNKRMVQNKTAPNDLITTKPVIILTNGYTASACEVLTGTMQDNKRATIIGTTTFGKGVIQKIFKLSDGSGLHITVMSYYTPNHNQINYNGITPDIEILFTRKDIFFRRDIQLLKAIKILLNT